MVDSNTNAYTVLGLPKGSSDKDIKAAYVNLVKKYDPEKHTERFMVIQRAYDRLRNTKSRAQEDVYSYNLIQGEYLFQPDEKNHSDKAPSESDLVKARAEYKQEPLNELKRTALCRLLFELAHYSVKRKQLGDTIRAWTEVLDVEPTHIRARHNLELASAALGHSYALHGLVDEAIELWEKALQMNPDSTELIQNLALAAEKAKDPERAGRYWAETVHRWKQRLEKDPEDEYLRFCIVEALNHHGEYVEEHQVEIQRARDRKAPAPQAHAPAQPQQRTEAPKPQAKPAAHTAPAAGQHQAPASQEQRPLSSSRVKIPSQLRNSDSKTAIPKPGSVPSGGAQIATGIERYREIVKLNPNDFDAHFQLCSKLMEDQLFEEAKNELMELAKKHPKNIEVLNLLGWALLNSGQKDLAFNAWKKSLSIDPTNASTREHLVRAHLSMGKAFRNKGLFTQALVHFKQLLTYMPQSAEVHLEIAATYDMKGDVRSAGQEYNRVLSLDPKNKVARKALNDLRLKR